jgi:hypothetical protein
MAFEATVSIYVEDPNSSVKAYATPYAARLLTGSGILAMIALTKGISRDIINQVDCKGSQKDNTVR